ncbi:hypothetical protein CEXT_273081 [Caerostris extrusa]|uniref:Uncharacterized protein n=1 Tax=Caerostris extrusa TaxID=172846 RepID=A0AAV4SUN4_CAEEX|nr:hypothetical protein CEXT_273081 [Caerostris extrusa]
MIVLTFAYSCIGLECGGTLSRERGPLQGPAATHGQDEGGEDDVHGGDPVRRVLAADPHLQPAHLLQPQPGDAGDGLAVHALHHRFLHLPLISMANSLRTPSSTAS